ncbi:restriction endonuclease subunit S [Marivirga tractuosa]|uniref:restriction endonuclease subunit S n=1 Tax=Marivirga tractuosa TaxID=1006 RepID=UPI0035CF10C2
MKLIQQFKELTNLPKNAEQLKGLILQLAIQGNLTKTWRGEHTNVESASVLLEQIKAEKEQLIKEKTIRKDNIGIVDMDKVYFEIPDSWAWARIGNIGFVFNGDSINKNLKESKYEGLSDGYPYIATKDVGYLNDPINYENGIKIPFNETQFKIAQKGSVLICSEGGSAGKKMGIVEEDVCFGNKLYAIKQFANIYPTYIQAVYGSKSFQNAFKESMTGIIGGISRNNFASLYFPLPPLDEQKAIVEIVEQLFEELEQLEVQTKLRVQLKEDYVTSALRELSTQSTEQAWTSLIPHFKEFFTEKGTVKKLRETVLQLAVQGKLTKKWRAENPDVEPASALLEKIKAEKEQLIKEKKIKKEKPLPPIHADEIPYELPDSWEWARCSKLTKPTSTITYGILKPVWVSDGIPTVRIKDMINGEISLESIVYCDPKRAEKFSKTTLLEGDLLIAKDGGTLGKTAFVQKELTGGNITQHVLRFSINANLDNVFLRTVIDSPYGQEYMKGETKGAALPGVNVGDFRKMPIGIPSLEEQKVIVEKVNTFLSFCDQLERAIEESTIQIEQLMQSCLKEVFEGDINQ